jgi:SAM-dependent methyltransferase
MLEDNYLQIIDKCILQVRSDVPEMQAWVHSYERHHRHRLAYDLMMVHQWANPSARILEVGSAPFILTLALEKIGYRVVGLDIDPDRFIHVITNNKLDVRGLNIEKEPLPFPDETFELILFNEIFEHLRINPIATMTEMRRVLKSKGSLFLSTPNLRSLRGIWMLVFHHKGGHVRPDIYEEYKKLELFGHMGHVREYTAKEVSTFLARVGLETRQTIYRFYDPIYQAQLKAKTLQTIEKIFCVLFPSFRPLFSLVCVKGSKCDG